MAGAATAMTTVTKRAMATSSREKNKVRPKIKSMPFGA
jgi:hypothetical protein